MVSQQLPNGTIVVMMTPREATMIADELLDPEKYPWQNSESMMAGMELRFHLRDLVTNRANQELHTASNMLIEKLQQQQQEEQQEEQ